MAEIQQMNSRRADVAPVTTPETTAIAGREYIEPARQEMQQFYKKAVELTQQLMP